LSFAVETVNLTKRFGNILAINRLNLKVKVGENSDFGVLTVLERPQQSGYYAD